jgi:hypothetical protein
VFAFELGNQPGDCAERGGTLGFGQDDPAEPLTDNHCELTVTELGVKGVDPNIEAPAPRPRQRRRHGLARRRLLGGRDRILEVGSPRRHRASALSRPAAHDFRAQTESCATAACLSS